MTQPAQPGHPFEVATVAQLRIDEIILAPHQVQEVAQWLSYALRVEDYDGDEDEWEY